MECRDFILPEPASYVFFYAVFNLRNLLYIIAKCAKRFKILKRKAVQTVSRLHSAAYQRKSRSFNNHGIPQNVEQGTGVEAVLTY